jgi:hypothetical protein
MHENSSRSRRGKLPIEVDNVVTENVNIVINSPLIDPTGKTRGAKANYNAPSCKNKNQFRFILPYPEDAKYKKRTFVSAIYLRFMCILTFGIFFVDFIWAPHSLDISFAKDNQLVCQFTFRCAF